MFKGLHMYCIKFKGKYFDLTQLSLPRGSSLQKTFIYCPYHSNKHSMQVHFVALPCLNVFQSLIHFFIGDQVSIFNAAPANLCLGRAQPF